MQVNSNGVLSFRNPFSSSYSMSFPIEGDILIAPFWDNIQSGEIYYRFTDNETLLDEVATCINDAFDGTFSPDFLFIATWNQVADGTSNNFNEVRISNHTIQISNGTETVSVMSRHG